jgi:hypothetical protein
MTGDDVLRRSWSEVGEIREDLQIGVRAEVIDEAIIAPDYGISNFRRGARTKDHPVSWS